MNRGYALGVVMCLLSACVARPPQEPPGPSAAQLRQQILELPGAELETGEELAIAYPGESLYGRGAVVPFPGGREVLDPLADFLASQPRLSWVAQVRADTGVSEAYDVQLAEKRAELLQRYFRNRNLSEDLLVIRSEGAGTPALVLRLAAPLTPEAQRSSAPNP